MPSKLGTNGKWKANSMELIDFSNCKEKINIYKGSEKKKTLIYNQKQYLVKFPDPVREKNKCISYINNAYSEYIGSKIFESIEFKTQNVLLGYYNFSGKEKIVCACEDFTDENNILYEFENFTISSVDKKIETEISDIIEVLSQNSNIINVEKTINEFWKMFIVDCLIGNTDRHNGNWGFIANEELNNLTFAPIYDCGSCLSPLLDEEEIEKKIRNETEIKNIALNTYSCLKEENKKISYYNYITSLKNKECNKALAEIFPKIDMEKINLIIDEIDCITETRKNFYKKVIHYRYTQILDKTYKRL